MEHSGTGGYDGHDLTKRVGKLEGSVEALHHDAARTQATLAGIVASQDAHARALQDIANKLDQHRTKRPEMGAMAAVAAVILSIGAATLWPVYQRLDRGDAHIEAMTSILIERAQTIGKFSAEKDSMDARLRDLHNDVNEMKNDRFTKQDGQRLEDKVDKLHGVK